MGIGGGGAKSGLRERVRIIFFSTVVVSFVGIGCNVSSIFSSYCSTKYYWSTCVPYFHFLSHVLLLSS